MQTVELDVQGMTCGGCVASVKRLLSAVQGVSDAQVNLESHSARVTYDESRTDAGKLIAAVEDGGYDASLR